MAETQEPFFHREGNTYTPTLRANGWWRPTGNLHARVMIGLFAHVIEQQYGEPDLQPARLTADLYRLPDLAPITVSTRIVRQGARIKVIEAELFSGGVSSARASCQLLRRSQQPEASVWAQTGWDAAPPDQVAPPPKPFTDKWEMRPILPPGAIVANDLRAPGPRRTWLREVRPLVGGEPYTPFSPSANGLATKSSTTRAPKASRWVTAGCMISKAQSASHLVRRWRKDGSDKRCYASICSLLIITRLLEQAEKLRAALHTADVDD
jgi:hypothetical protein